MLTVMLPAPSVPPSGADGAGIPFGSSPCSSSSNSCCIRLVDRVGARVIRTVRHGRRLRTRGGIRCRLGCRGLRGKLALQLVEQLAEKLVGHVRPAGAAGVCDPSGPSPNRSPSRPARRDQGTGRTAHPSGSMLSAGLLSSAFHVPSLTLSRIWRAWSIGTAKPMPSLPPEALAMAVLMPIARPSPSISGPPELPELIAASVWIRSCSSPIGVGTVRPSALTMPVVTVWLRPNGLPMAIVISPTCTSARAPRAVASDRSRHSHRPG